MKNPWDLVLKKEGDGKVAATEGDVSLLAPAVKGSFFKVSETGHWKEGIGHHTWERRRRAGLPSKVAPHPEARVRDSTL